MYTGGIRLKEPGNDPPARWAAADADARGKGKQPTTEQMEVDSSDDEGTCYSTLLDHLSIFEDLFFGINSFKLASSVFTVEDLARDSSYSFD